MREIYQTITDFINLIDDDPTATIIVQDNQYLDFFVRQLNQHRLNEGRQAWLSPNIMTMSVWSKELWNRLHLHTDSLGENLPKLLDPLSERLIFGKLVQAWNKQHNNKLLNVEGTASAVVKCWRLLCQYNCTPKLPPYAEFFFNPIADKQQQFSPVSEDFVNYLHDKELHLYAINEDHKFFIQIAKNYCRYMEERLALSGLLLPNALIHFLKLLPHEAWPQNKRLIFANFIEYTYPQLDAWQQSLAELGFQIEKPIYKNAPVAELNLIGRKENDKIASPFQNFEQELAQAVNYLKPRLSDPNYSAALIVSQQDETVYHLLDKYINPQILFIESASTRSYKTSGGLSLLTTPLGSDLSAIIRLIGQKLNRQQILSLVQNNFIYGAKIEFAQRCHLYASIYQDCRSEYGLKDLYDLARKTQCIRLANLAALSAQFAPSQSSNLSKSFKSLKEKYKKAAATSQGSVQNQNRYEDLLLDWPQQTSHFASQTYDLYTWIRFCRALLQMWVPCPKELNPKLIVLTYLSRLRSFCTISNYYSVDPLTFNDFRRYLRLGLSNVKLPSSDYTQEAARLSIINLRKTLRRHFTEVILLGFNAETFPSPVKYHGFIPQLLLADLGWPQANNTLCLQTALNALQALRHCADRVIISFANNFDKNGTIVATEVSPLWQEPSLRFILTDYDKLAEPANTATSKSPNMLSTYGLHSFPIEQAKAISETIKEIAPPPARPNKLEKDGALSFQGGVKVISSMANCPLQALLCYRLGCSSHEDIIKNGFDTSLDRGNLLHKCLQKFWNEYKNEPDSQNISSRSQAIKSIFGLDKLSISNFEQIDFSPLQLKIKNLVHEVLQSEEYQNLSPYVLDNEENSATEVLLSWIKNELNWDVRQDFSVIALEQPITLSIQANPHKNLPHSELVCSGTIDRIDELQNKQKAIGRIIIDYKTGNAYGAIVKSWDPSDNFSENKQNRDYQLPLYAFASGSDVYQGILFAKLKSTVFTGKANFSNDAIQANLQGAISDDTLGSSPESGESPNNWEDFKLSCQKRFQELATQYLEGSCQRTQNQALCGNCPFQHLCHIGGLDDEADNEEEKHF